MCLGLGLSTWSKGRPAQVAGPIDLRIRGHARRPAVCHLLEMPIATSERQARAVHPAEGQTAPCPVLRYYYREAA